MLSDATVKRILGTLRRFMTWICGVLAMSIVIPLKRSYQSWQNRKRIIWPMNQVEDFSSDGRDRELLRRNLALFAVLQHGIRAEAATLLNVGDFDGKRLRQDKADSKGDVLAALDEEGIQEFKAYLNWQIS